MQEVLKIWGTMLPHTLGRGHGWPLETYYSPVCYTKFHGSRSNRLGICRGYSKLQKQNSQTWLGDTFNLALYLLYGNVRKMAPFHEFGDPLNIPK